MKKNFLELLGKKLLFFDGAMGTLLQKEGLKAGEIPELWNVKSPEKILNIHKMYLKAGANIIETNSFGLNPARGLNYGESPEVLMREAVLIGKKAIEEFKKESSKDALFLAASLGPTGHLIEPIGTLSFDKAYEGYKSMAIEAEKAGADLILLETMTDTYEAKAAMLAVKENTKLPFITSFMIGEDGHLLTGGDIISIVSLVEGLGACAIGLNCGFGPKELGVHLKKIAEISSIPIMFNSNAGLPIIKNNEPVFSLDPNSFAEEIYKLLPLGIHLLGGCCGTTPNHIEKIVEKCQNSNFMNVKVKQKNLTMISSYGKGLIIDDIPLLIGEKINPSGNATLKKHILNEDFSYVKTLAKQQSKTSHILDVNMGLPKIDEVSYLKKAIQDIQSIVDTPLMIDTSNPKALEEALRYYNGKAFINSVSGKKSSLDNVLPLAKKYGGILIALTLDDNGIPKSVNERIKIAKKIIKEGEKYGLSSKDFIIDPLALTLSSDPNAPKDTLQAIEQLTKINLKTSIGVSNVSFGLPDRKYLTASFFLMALQKGLSMGIVDSLSNEILSSYYAFLALQGKDKDCKKYIEYNKKKDELLPHSNLSHHVTLTKESSQKNIHLNINESNQISINTLQEKYVALNHSIYDGLKDATILEAIKLLSTNDPLEIINQGIIPALSAVGEAFEKKDIFLPQLLASAEAAQGAFSEIKGKLKNKPIKKKGKIILATVKGDIHDIGKNIVKVILENYGYDIIDLGKDVDPKIIAQEAAKNQIKLVGLSALMTTTVQYMEETIQEIHKRKLPCKVVVGGAVLNEAYSKAIKADAYCKDAMATLKYAEKIFSE